MQHKISRAWELFINNIFILFCVLYLFSCFHLMIEQIVHKTMLCYLFAVIVSVIFFFINYIFIKYALNISIVKNVYVTIELSYLRKTTIVFLLFILPFIIRVSLLVIFQTPILGDPALYIDISKEIAFDNFVSRNVEYSSNFPHLFWFGFFLVPAALFSNFGDWVFQVYISLILSFNALFVYGIAKLLCKSKSGALITAIIYSYLPSQLFCGLTVTHEYAFTFFVLAAVYIYIKRKSMFSWIIFCILLSIARLVNSTGIIIFIALVCCFLFTSNNTKKIKYRLISIALMTFIIVLVSFSANLLQRKMTYGDVNLNQSSVEWQLYIGGNTETEGRYSIQDVNKINEVVENSSSVADAKVELRKLVIGRWKSIVNNPGKLIAFLLSKFCNVWSGTHYSIELVGSYVSGDIGHTLMLLLMLINNLMYSSLISISLVGLWKKRKSSEVDFITFLKIIIIGTVCMLLLTETMNKYSLTMIGPVILLFGFYLDINMNSYKMTPDAIL